MTNDTARQLELEATSVSRGVDRYYASRNQRVDKNKEWDDDPESQIITRMIDKMLPAAIQYQKDARSKLVKAQTSGRRLSGWEMPLAVSDMPTACYIAIRAIISGLHGGKKKHNIARYIGRILNWELKWQEMREQERDRAKLAPPNRIAYLKNTVKVINPKSLAKWLKKLDDVVVTRWDNETCLRVGLELMGIMKETCQKYVTFEMVLNRASGKMTSVLNIVLDPYVVDALTVSHERIALSGPWLVPMVCKPTPWAWDGDQYTGGYLTIQEPIIKIGRDRHTADLYRDGGIPQVCLDAINAVSQTAWIVNEPVRRLAEIAVADGWREVSPVEPALSMVPRLTPEEWAMTSPKQRVRVLQERRAAHDSIHKGECDRNEINRCLRVASDMRNEERMYFPHNIDFRGRAYPLPQDLHPQGRDFARGMLTFADAVPLGPTGLRWLSYQTASTYGVDKVSRDDQMDWVIDNLDNISTTVRDPYGEGYAFWCEAEEPWQFMAAAIELEAAFNYPTGAENFPSRLPVSVDGSCNGIQHLSAMGLDPVGAHATNLTSDPQRQDIYQIVADKVAVKVGIEARCQGRVPEAEAWLGKVTRKTVKRGVMTTPYGVTNIGMRDQLIADKFTRDPKSANYLRDRMVEAIADTVVVGRDIMDWMQDNAAICGANEKAFTWTTPSGFKCRQLYLGLRHKRVNTLIGSTYLWLPDKTAGIDQKKQRIAIAPNVIHSFDAAHMALTIEEAHRRWGIPAFAVVHDSFGCHAAYMDTFVSVVRSEFVKIYQNDWFSTLQWEFQQSAGEGVNLIPPPERGDFDITEVNDAQFFFA